MTWTNRLGAALAAGLLGAVLIGTPAMADPEARRDPKADGADADQAPGRADRDREAGRSGTQGKSESNPDGGGVDKPYPADGQPARSQGSGDFDGNNGCGNDRDFEDDNNGNCGNRRGRPADERPKPQPEKRPTETDAPASRPKAGPTDRPAGAVTAVPEPRTTAASPATATPRAPRTPPPSISGVRNAGTPVTSPVVRTPAAQVEGPAEVPAQVLGLRLERGADTADLSSPVAGGAPATVRGPVTGMAATGAAPWLLALAGAGLLFVSIGTLVRRSVRT